MSILDYIFSKLPDNSSKKITAKDVRDSFEKTDERINQVVSGIKGNATQANAPTAYTPEAYPNGLFETYVVRKPLTMPNSWGSAVTQSELDANYVFFDVKNGVVTKSLSAKSNEIADNSVTPEKTTFSEEILIYNKNRFDKSEVVLNKYVNSTNGNLEDSESYKSSGFMYVGDCQEGNITITTMIHIAFYNKDKAFISGGEYLGNTVAVPINAIYSRITLTTGKNVDTFQVEKGDVLTVYEAYQEPTSKIYIENLILDKNIQSEIFFANPSEIYAVTGRQIDFLFESFIITNIGRKLSEYTASAFGGYGKFLSDRTRLVPSVDTTFDFRVERLPNISIENSISVKYAPLSNGSGVTRKVLVIGDSTVNSGYLIKAISDFFALDAMNVTFIGTRNTLGIAHEGRAGWSYEGYLTQASISGISNPFFDGTTFNFSNYLTTTSQTIGANDWVFIQLGINDLYSISGSFFEGDIEKRVQDMKTYLTEMISQIHGENSNIRIGLIMTTPPAISQDATGNLLSSAYYSSEYYMKKGLLKWWNELIESYDNATAKSNKIYLIPCNMVLDRVNNFQTEEQYIDAFNTNKKTVQIDDVHPSESGYKQMATAYIGAIKYFA